MGKRPRALELAQTGSTRGRAPSSQGAIFLIKKRADELVFFIGSLFSIFRTSLAYIPGSFE